LWKRYSIIKDVGQVCIGYISAHRGAHNFRGIAMYNDETHRVWHKFLRWLEKVYGEGLTTTYTFSYLKSKTGKPLKYKFFDYNELNKRLVGGDVITRVERYVRKYCPEIKVIHADDYVFAGSTVLLIPHPKFGVTVMFIPHCTDVQNQFFLHLYECSILVKELAEMKRICKRKPTKKNRSDRHKL
jgi:hypothetical protein